MASDPNREVLAAPRALIEQFGEFTHWPLAEEVWASFEKTATWHPRTFLEASDVFVQPIPSALIRNSEGRYLVLKRIERDRLDMSGKVTLVIGGHVDKDDSAESFNETLLLSLKRELDEELALRTQGPFHPVGLVFDNTSLRSSRHFGVIFETVVDRSPTVLATEEFLTHSDLSGRFLSLYELGSLKDKLDPWSRILFHEYLRKRKLEPGKPW